MSSVRTIDISALIDGHRLGGFNYRLVSLSWLITAFDGLGMMMVGFTAPYMRDEFGLSKMMLGRVFSSGLVGMMIGGFCFSWLGDRIGRRPTIVITALGFGALTTATAFAGSYQALLAPHYGWQVVYLAGGIGTLLCALALWAALPESIRLLGVRQCDPARIVAILRRLDPASDATPADRYLLSDEPPAEAHLRVAQLYRGDLRWMTPLLWIGYIASSFAIYFSASWGPSALEELHFPRLTSALVSSLGGLLGAVAGLMLMRFTDRIGAIAVAWFPILAIGILLVQGFDLVPQALFLASVVLGGMVLGGAHFGDPVDRRHLLSECHSRQRCRLGDIGGQDRRHTGPGRRRGGAGQRLADIAQLRVAGRLPGGIVFMRHRHTPRGECPAKLIHCEA